MQATWIIALVSFALATPGLAQNRRAAPVGDAEAAKAFDSLDAAIAAIKSDDSKQQIAAAQWMAATKPDAAVVVPSLVRLLDSPALLRDMGSRAIRVNPATAAAGAVSVLGPAAIGPLAAAFDHPSVHVRTNILLLLQRHGDDPKVLAVMTTGTKDAENAVRQQAATGLGRSNTPEAVTALLPLLKDNEASVRSAAAWSLSFAAAQRTAGTPISNVMQANVVKDLCELLKDPDKNVKISAADSLGRLHNSNAVRALAAAVDDPDVRTIAVQSLGQIGNSWGTPAVLKALQLKDGEDRQTTRALAAQALGKLVDLRAVKPLIAALKDEDEIVRQWSADSLGLIGDRRAVGPLIEVLKEKDVKNEQVRLMAARSLGRIRDPRALEPLIAALAEKPLRYEAARALGALRDPAAIEPLAKLLFDDANGQTLQETFAWAISQIRDPRAIRALAEGAIAAMDQKQTSGAFVARRTLDKLLDTSFDFDSGNLKAWWAEHKDEFGEE